MFKISVMTIALVLAAAAPQGVAEHRPLTIVAAPPVTDSGLIDVLLARFTAHSGIAARVLPRPVALPLALTAAERGDVDVVIVNDAAAAHHFMESGHGVKRRPFMRDEFAIVGPADDPAGVRGGGDAAEALRSIARLRLPFLSRGEEAGDAVEQRLWAAVHVNPKARAGHRYVESGLDMRATLELAVRRGSYALADCATWFALADHGALTILVEGDPRLSSLYEAILVDPSRHLGVDPSRHPGADAAAGAAFIDFLLSPEGRAAIAGFAIGPEHPFIPAGN